MTIESQGLAPNFKRGLNFARTSLPGQGEHQFGMAMDRIVPSETDAH